MDAEWITGAGFDYIGVDITVAHLSHIALRLL